MKLRGARATIRTGGRRAAAPRAVDELDEVFAAVAKYFGLLSEPTRLKILHAICNEEHSVSEIVAATGATQTNVSRHLALLRDAGIVSRRKDRNAVFYKVADRVFADVCRTVCVHIASGIDARAPLREDLLAFVRRH
ncbi:MAG TPA: metalloregulator ArsR/SmtB family transcription factor [Casimicrobiaceae bacterium]|nr:metalloregulator ArsR/SmtB family transcription factor [Casimicrobiaceae bacterium]